MRKFSIAKNSKKQKKGMFALETLIGTILSVIALIVLVSLFAKVFLQTPTNEKIAQYDAQSFVDFVDYSSNKYKLINDCYTSLKLSNLENYQFEEENKNYFYIISKERVYIVNMKYLGDIKEKKIDEKDFKKIAYSSKKFKNEINITYDETPDSKFTLELYFMFQIGKVGKIIELKDAQYILLVPQFDRQFGFFEVSFLDSNQNILMGKTFVNDKLEEPKGYYLGFVPSTNELFLTKSSLSNMLVNSNTCFVKNMNKYTYDKYIKANPEKADYINEELTFDYVVEGKGEQNIKFVWKLGVISCPDFQGKTCKDYLGDDYEKINYYDFLKKIQEVTYRDITPNIPGVGETRLVNRNLLTVKEIQDRIKEIDRKNMINLYYEPKNLFDVYNIGNYKITDLNKKKLEEYFEQKIFHGFKKYNNCVDNNKLCDYVGYKAGNAYFYSSELNSFVSFNQNLLMRKGQKIYYFGQEYDFEGYKNYQDSETYEIIEENGKKVSLDQTCFWCMQGNYNFYIVSLPVKINNEFVSRGIIMSAFQLNQVKEVSENEK